MSTTLCERCFPDWGHHELQSKAIFAICEECQKTEAQDNVKLHTFRGDPRIKVSDTPRTDAAEVGALYGTVHCDFARTLERELSAVTRERRYWEDEAKRYAGNADHWREQCDALRAEVERLTECLKRANEQAEEFERKWYLRGDEVERLRETAQEFIRDYIDGDMGDIKSYVKTFRAALQEPTP